VWGQRVPSSDIYQEDMAMNTITIPADVVPLLYAGLQLDLWQCIVPQLDELLERPGRAEHPEWFTEPFERFCRTLALLEEIDWPRADPPAECEIELDTHRAALTCGLRAELKAQRYAVEEETGVKGDVELREPSMRAIDAIEGFLAGLSARAAAEAAEREIAGRFTDPSGIERAIVLQVMRDDHAARWDRAELVRELHDVDPRAIGDALARLKARGVIHLEGQQVMASLCTRYLSTLEMLSI
jgi:hypothetical protein